MLTHFCSAEINQLKRLQVVKPVGKKLEEIPQPTRIMSLQDAMGLMEDKKMYSHCQVSHLFSLPLLYTANNYSSQLFEMS